MLTAVTGTYQNGPLQLRVTFSFNIAINGLICVNYGVNSHDNDEVFKAAVKRYGPPQKNVRRDLSRHDHLEWTTPTDRVDTTLSKDDPAFAMQ